MSEIDPPLTFSQRNGHEDLPNQMQLGVVSPEFRRLIMYAFHVELSRVTRYGTSSSYFEEPFNRVAKDLHVRQFGRPISDFRNSPFELERDLTRRVAKLPHNRLFDLIEFFAQHREVSGTLKLDMKKAFVDSRLAYRLVDDHVIVIGNDLQGDAFLRSLDDVSTSGQLGARTHLIAAGRAMSDGQWRDSIRESIHAVESVAKNISEDDNGTLNSALKKIGKRKAVNDRLKAAFEKLYSYTNDGSSAVRHAIVFPDSEQVDEADALFMLGACASFVSYLIAKNPNSDEKS